MELQKSVKKLLNEQVKNEFESAYLYLGMAAYFNTTPFKGMAHWMTVQSGEEIKHGMKIFNYLQDRNDDISLAAISAPITQYVSPLEAFEKAYNKERAVTGLIHAIYEEAIKQHDFETQILMNWFINEQIEEEKQTLDFVDKLRLAEKSPNALFAIDAEAAKRSE